MVKKHPICRLGKNHKCCPISHFYALYKLIPMFCFFPWFVGVTVSGSTFFFSLIKYSFHMSESTYAPLNYSSLRSGQKQTVLLSRYHRVHVLKNLNTIKCISPTHPTIGLVVQCNMSLNTIDMWKEYLIKIFLFQRFLFNPSPRFPCWCIFSIYCISLPQWLILNNQNCEAPSLLTISSTLFFPLSSKKEEDNPTETGDSG